MSYHRFSIVQGRAVIDKRITNAQFRTLGALGMYADVDGWCFPSQSTIGGDLGKSRQTVNEDIAALVQFGYLEKKSEPKPGNPKEVVMFYRLLHDPIPTGGVGIPGQGVSEYPDSNDSYNDPSNVTSDSKPNLLDGMIHFANTKQAQDAQAVEELFQLLEKELKLNYNRTASNESIVKKIYKEHKSGRTIQRWITWAKEDKWKLEHGYYANLKNVWSTYPLAFKSSKASKMLDIS